VGSATEATLIAPIVDAVSGAVSLVGRTTLPEFAALVERAALVVCGNSAALHLADALRRPVVVLYSGTDLESQWQPRHTASVILRRETDCHPCYRFDCPFDMECLDIAPADVVAAGLRLLEVEGQSVEEEPCAVSAS
jgi:ADP-heptose:LPS heptosyltransferase